MLFIKVFVISLSIMDSLSYEVDGFNPVMATFQVCDTNADNGLNMEEIMQDGCEEVLQTLFGLSTDQLQDTFFRLDENMDKIISIEEGHTASQSFDRLELGSFEPLRILVTTGGNDVEGVDRPSLTTEIINLENPSFRCTKVGKFPKDLYFANGGWVGNKPMVCGGSSDSVSSHHYKTSQKSCYTLQTNGTWKEDKNAALIRGKQNQISGSVVINNQLYIPEYVGQQKSSFVPSGAPIETLIGLFGSFWYKKAYLNFEMAAPNTAPNTLQSLNSWGIFNLTHRNFDNKYSCIVKWDANTIMLIGANSGGKDTYFINLGNKTVTPGPQLMQGRYKHACNELTVNNLYTQKSESFIVVTGGVTEDLLPSGPYLKSTEILPKSPYNHYFGKWMKGPDSPIELYGHQMVASSDKTKLYTIGNTITTMAKTTISIADTKRIFQFSCYPLCGWKEMPTKLKEGRYGHVAFAISNELTQKICN